VKPKVFFRLNDSLKTMTDEKPEILAVHKQRLEQFLKELEIWEPFSKQEFKCIACGETITMDNVGAIIPSGENIVFCCSNEDCLFKAVKQLETKQETDELRKVELEEQEADEAESQDAKE
jgi:hypothetical protein